MIRLFICILAFVIAVVALVYSIHVAVVFHRFNDGIKDWATNLDLSTNSAIQRAARQILKELDEKITEQKALARQDEEVESDEV